MKKTGYFSPAELLLWFGSLALITLSFPLSGNGQLLTLIASLIGVSSLIFCAKGNPLGQLLIIVFSLLYGIISYRCRYYGEMLTYMGMTAPMAVFSLISWLRHPYKGQRSQVAVNRLSLREFLFMLPLTLAVTVIFYFILACFATANLLPSTLSVTTSFMAVYLSCRRSPFYALAYAANDAILIWLWILASLGDRSCISMVVCFGVFFVNDIYGLINWLKMEKIQQAL